MNLKYDIWGEKLHMHTHIYIAIAKWWNIDDYKYA